MIPQLPVPTEGKTLEGMIRDMSLIRPDTYQDWHVRERNSENRLGVQITIGENSIIDEFSVEGRYEIFPSVNGKSIRDLFGYRDETITMLTLEQAVIIAEAAMAAKNDASKLPELKATIDAYYPSRKEGE